MIRLYFTCPHCQRVIPLDLTWEEAVAINTYELEPTCPTCPITKLERLFLEQAASDSYHVSHIWNDSNLLREDIKRIVQKILTELKNG